jgi:hypothetical protein
LGLGHWFSACQEFLKDTFTMWCRCVSNLSFWTLKLASLALLIKMNNWYQKCAFGMGAALSKFLCVIGHQFITLQKVKA